MRQIFLMLLFSVLVFPQKSVTISGYVRDKASGESLIGATVQLQEAKAGAKSNVYGFYSITVPAGKYNLKASYVGYEVFKKEIDLQSNLKLDIELASSSAISEEVVVTAEREDANVSSIEMSSIELGMETIKKIPALLGEVDVIKSIQLLPGVSTVGEGATGFNVRGGGIDQNLVLLDEAPVFNQSHLFGFFSVFNPDAVKDVKLIKGGIPAQYGGRLSSILDVRLKEGNNRKFNIDGGIGTIFSRFSVEGPIIEDKLSFIVAGRRSYIDVLAQPFLTDGLDGSQFYFYDLTAKANYKIDDRNTVFVSGYFGRDVFGATGFLFNWGNQTGTLRWNHLFSDKLFSNFTYYFSNYDYGLLFGEEGVNSFGFNSLIQTQSFKYDLDYFINSKNTLRFGVSSIFYDFLPGEDVEGSSEGQTIPIEVAKRKGIESAAYIDHQYEAEKLTIKYGARLSHFANIGPYEVLELDNSNPGRRKEIISRREVDVNEMIADYFNLEPRASIKYSLNKTSSLKLGYNRMAQYIHLMSNTAAATPLDLYAPTSNNIKPQVADQLAFGYFKNFDNDKWETSLELYYKDMQNIVGFIDASELTLNNELERDLLQGIGRAYGAELYIKKATGKLNGWLSYTLSKTERQIDGISNDEWFDARFDQTHKINLTAIYDYSKQWSFSANFVYLTGTPITLPNTVITWGGNEASYNPSGERNNYRITDYHRLDLSVTYKPFNEPDDWWKGEWVFGVYNIYGRRNAYSIYPGIGENGARQANRLSIIGAPVPSITYNFNFDINQVIN